MTNQDINNKLESLVHNRFTKDELNAKLSQLFGCKVEVAEYERAEYIDDGQPKLDDQLLFNINNEINVNIDVDLYYIITNAKQYYITETCFNYA